MEIRSSSIDRNAAMPEVNGSDPADGFSKLRALVVEDNQHTAYLLEFMLQREGYEVIAVANGRDARDAIRSDNAADVVLLDLMLPYVSGYQLIGEMRENPAWRQVPIVVVSGKVLEQDIVRALDLGADDYVTKPFRPQELLARIRRAIAQRRPPSTAA